jgi:capsular exopolysaccharide synthesis family protein
MSRIYDALKKLEAERLGRKVEKNGGSGNGGGNGAGNGGNGKRRGWRRFLGANGGSVGHPTVALRLNPDPEVEEAYQRLGTNLLLPGKAGAGPIPHILGVTACRHGEGATTTSALFGSILVRRRKGRVAVVEANLRSPTFDAVFGVRRDGGFAELIQGQKSVAEVALPTEVPNLFAICSGHSTVTPPALFDSPGVATALEQLKKEFDFVVVDLPPANVYSDTSILAPLLDATLIVIEADRTRVPEIERLRRTLEHVGARVVGSVLNRRRDYIPAFLEEML